MALRAGYYGLKQSLLNKVKALPGIKSIGAGLSLNSTTGELVATAASIDIEANPEEEATENLIKLGLDDVVYAVPDAAKTYQTDDDTESAIVDADYIPFLDSSAASGSGAPKKSTWTNFISKIKAKITEYVTWEANSVLGAKNRAYSQTNNSAIANIVSGLSYKVSWEGSATITLKKNDASGATIVSGSTSPLEFTADDNYSLYFGSSTDVTNIMVYDAADTDTAYTPYAMTNRELTVNLPVATASTLDDVISIMAQKTICLINSSNNHLINALTNNDLQDTTCKIIAYKQGGGIIDWYGMAGASAFCIGRITNGVYISHKKATLT